jgi:hypothetical protein
VCLIKFQAAIADIIDYPTILFPIDDFSAISVAENATALDPRYIFPRQPENLPRLLANKASFYSLCCSIEIPCARSIVPNSVDEVHEFIEQATFPVVMPQSNGKLLIVRITIQK